MAQEQNLEFKINSITAETLEVDSIAVSNEESLFYSQNYHEIEMISKLKNLEDFLDGKSDSVK